MTGVTDILVGPNDPATLQPDAGNLRFKQCFSTHILHGETLKYTRAKYLFPQMPPSLFFQIPLGNPIPSKYVCYIYNYMLNATQFIPFSRSMADQRHFGK